MKIGDVMIPLTGYGHLRSGGEAYTHAILCSIEPFVMISQRGDMLWGAQSPANFVALCEASPTAREPAYKRFFKEYGYSPGSTASGGDGK